MFGDVKAAIGAGIKGGSLNPLASPAGAGIGALSGSLLGRLAESLDKPGRAVRGLLSGRPEEALAFVPFSDTLGLTNPENQVSGMEMLGLQEDPGEAEQLLGMIAEMATDPLTYMGMFGGSKIGSGIKGALQSGGQVATANDAATVAIKKAAQESLAAQRAATSEMARNPLISALAGSGDVAEEVLSPLQKSYKLGGPRSKGPEILSASMDRLMAKENPLLAEAIADQAGLPGGMMGEFLKMRQGVFQ